MSRRQSQPQPPRISNQQNPGDSSQSQNPGKIVPITPSQIIPSSHGQPSYKSALASPAPRAINPYQVENQFSLIQRPSSSYPAQSRSPYVKKAFIQHISYIEPHLVHVTDPLALAMEVLPPNWHFLPRHPEKNIQFYKSILSQEKSAQIENIYSKGFHSRNTLGSSPV